MIWAIHGCAVKETPKYQLTDGYYKSQAFRSQSKKVYIDNSEDTIFVYTMNKRTGQVDTVAGKHTFPQASSLVQIKTAFFKEASFDIDFLTIPFKYRGGQAGLPKQFNTNLNGAVYIGYRNDIDQLSVLKSPLNKYQRQTQHYGISYGLFTGFGGTSMNPWVTNNQISSEYDGVVWSKGIAGIVGINNFTIGLALGFDNLLDKNKKLWIYQRKPWLGLAFGLNLN
jgi:hypothetical protein